MTDSQRLLAKYVRGTPVAADRELVTCYPDIVYSTALPERLTALKSFRVFRGPIAFTGPPLRPNLMRTRTIRLVCIKAFRQIRIKIGVLEPEADFPVGHLVR